MAPLLRSRRKNLACHYCGRRSDLQFNGQSSFDCKYCDATNWLDEQGGIADPPATSLTSDGGSPAPRFIPRTIRQRSMSPTSRPVASPTTSGSIFCAKCQRNQEILTSVLKEYELPDDPRDPEYAVRVKKFGPYKRGFEARYPQVCAECEPKVQQQLQKASYTAKTDYLRRMMDRTKAHRHEVKKRGALDYVDLAGRWTWQAALILQLVWHATVLCCLLAEHEGGTPKEHWSIAYLRKASLLVSTRFPHQDRFVSWAFNLGLRQWYSYQVGFVLIRCVCLFISQYKDAKGITAMNQLGAHLFIAGFTIYVYRVAGKSIRTDNTPLFGSHASTRSNFQVSPPPRAREFTNDLGGILDEISFSANENAPKPSTSFSSTNPASSFGSQGSTLGSSSIVPVKPYRRDLGIGSLGLADTPTTPQQQDQSMQYGEEMDWSPSGSQHRAFSTHNPYKVKNPNPRFNDLPIEPKPGAFWYKVPPAPVNPAQKLRNPPMKPIIRESPKEAPENFFKKPARTLDLGSNPRNESSFTLRDPQFYAPGPKNDPTDGLSNMMGSFSISPSPDDRAAATRRNAGSSAFAANGVPAEDPNRTKGRMAELIILFAALWTWVTALGTPETYGPTIALGAMGACLLISMRLTLDLHVDAQIKDGEKYSVLRLSWPNLCAHLGMIQVVASLVLMWRIWSSSEGHITCGVHGNALLGVVVAHQIWQVFL
ncbi:hypothetical protein JX266_000153 [Neoarthrinium moseri]|nr:hypothetical protein JX266_000153 [Neoarthrinium moseri]